MTDWRFSMYVKVSDVRSETIEFIVIVSRALVAELRVLGFEFFAQSKPA
jgi:hypothetical protein